jgi:hypothetical protein
MRNGIHLQPRGAVLVRRGTRAPADAARWRRLPVPGVFAEDGGCREQPHFVILISVNFDVPRMLRGAISAFTRVLTRNALRRGALLIRGPSRLELRDGSRLCGAS